MAMTRREFIASAASMAAFVSQSAYPATREAIMPKAGAFDLNRVRLTAGPFLQAAEANRRYLHALDPDQLLHTFRLTATLPSSAKPIGGWEAPVNELRGHFTGHYLSACALASNSMADDTLKTSDGTLSGTEPSGNASTIWRRKSSTKTRS